MKEIRRRKPSPRRSRAKAVRALRCRFNVRIDATVSAQLGGFAGSLLDMLVGKGDRFAVELLLTAERQRTSVGSTPQQTFTVVYKGPHGLDFWDTATRTYAKLDAGLVPKVSIGPANIPQIEKRPGKGEVTFAMVTDDVTLGRVRHELTVSTREDWAPFGPALLCALLCGPVCHERSDFPWEEVANAGFVVRGSLFADGSNKPLSEFEIDSAELVDVREEDFRAPSGYRPLDEVFRKSMKIQDPPRPPDETTIAETQAATVSQALEGDGPTGARARLIRDNLTPDCLGSTRFGSISATIHQDLLTTAMNAINLVAPLLGSTTIAGGTWTVPWLTALTAIPAANPTAPGSGLACFLRQPRSLITAAPGGPPGGTGLMDRLAFRTLYEVDAAGLMRTQREAAAGTLAATLATWSAGARPDPNLATAVANLLAAPGGNLLAVSLADQRSITEAYEESELGVFSVNKLPAGMPLTAFGSFTFGPFTSAPLFMIGITGVGGTVNFASLGGGPLVTTATIGSAGNIVVGLVLPTITFTATVTRSITPAGTFVLAFAGSVLCAFVPFLCPLFATLATLVNFVMNNITVITAAATGVTWTLDVTFAFDPTTERVEPFVSVVGRTGMVSVTTTFVTPNIISNLIESSIRTLGNSLDAWGGLLAGQAAVALQETLRTRGIQLPVAGRQNELKAVGGNAISTSRSVLELMADVRPIDEASSQPWTTQVSTADQVRQEILTAHLNIRRDLNPQPVPPPLSGPVLMAGTFVGLGLSQNVLNYYVFQQWVARRFEVTITDPTVITQMVNAAPTLFVRSPVRVHLWPASPPRLEIAAHEVALGTRPLVVHFDDVRACFEVSTNEPPASPFGGLELSCNFKTSATISLAWPWVFAVIADPVLASAAPYEPRTWEFADPNVPTVMNTVSSAHLAKLIDFIAAQIIAPISTPRLANLPGAIPWTRLLPAMQQEIIPPIVLPRRTQQFYLELLARRKALYVLPVLNTTLLEMFDGSGAPTINGILTDFGAPPPLPTTIAAMTCAQGRALLPLLATLPVGP